MAEDGAVLGADEAGAVGPAELLAEEAELGGAVLVAGDRALAEGDAQRTELTEAEADLDVLGAGHPGVEGTNLIEDGAAEGGVGGDRVGRLRGEGELLPAAGKAGGLALGRGVGVGVLELAADAADLGVGEGLDELRSQSVTATQSPSMKAMISPRASSMPWLRALETPRRPSRRWRTG